MSWPRTDEELKAENVIKYIPPLLNSFLKTLFHRQANVKEESHRISQRRNSIAQDIVYCVSKGRIGPGELKYLTNLDKSDEYEKYSIEQKMIFLIWIALRCTTTPPILLVPGWTGLFSKAKYLI